MNDYESDARSDSAANPYAAPTADVTRVTAGAEWDDMVLAGRGERFLAKLLDTALFYGPATAASIITMFFLFGFRENPTEEWIMLTVVFTGIGVTLIVTGVQWFFLARDGQTIGKKALKIKIVLVADGSKPGFVRAVLLRNLVLRIINFVIGLVPILGPLANLAIGLTNPLMIFAEDRRCLHDHIAGTHVVDAE